MNAFEAVVVIVVALLITHRIEDMVNLARGRRAMKKWQTIMREEEARLAAKKTRKAPRKTTKNGK